MPRPRSPITKFILSLPRDLPIKAVISQAKAKGMATTESNVSRVRRLPGTKPGTKAPTAAKSGKPPQAAAKTPTAGAPSASVSKSEFIRQQPRTMSAAQVVEKAKAGGIAIEAALVYKVRGRAKAAKKGHQAARPTTPHASTRPAPKALSTAPRSTSTNGDTTTHASAISSVEDLLRAVAAELGLGRSIEILRGERARLRAMIGG